MLQAIREKAQGWIAWAIVILISIPFALFGIQQYLGVSSDPVVASVDGTDITVRQLERRVRELRDSMRQRLGPAFNADIFSDKLLKPQVLQAMIDETLLRQAADDWGMRVSDEQVAAYIRSLPGLQNGGKFDMRLYEATVRSRGLTKAGFEALVREEMIRAQQQSGIRDTAIVTHTDLAEQVRLGEQRRQIRYVRIPADGFLDVESIDDEEARQYYERSQRDYQVPERVKLAWILLDVKDLADEVPVDDEKVRQYFEDHRGEFVAEQERRVRHILIPVEGDDDQARQQAEQLIEQLRQGADFAALAKEHSKDPGSAADGGDLGWVNRGVMVKPFEDAVFAARPGEITGPVKTEFGYHIIEVTEVRGGAEASFEQVRDKVEAAYRRAQAEEIYYERLERLADLAYETPDSLAPAAEALGLKIQHSDWVTRNGGLPLAIESPKVVGAAFSDEVLGEGNNSDVIELAPTRAVVVRVEEHEEAMVKPFEEVKDEVRQAAARAKASDKARSEGEKRLTELREGGDLDGLAKANGWELKQATVGRRGGEGAPAEVARAAFDVLRPADGKPAYGGVVSANGDYFLVAVDQVIDGDLEALDQAQREQRLARLRQVLGSTEFRGVLQALRARADIEVMLK